MKTTIDKNIPLPKEIGAGRKPKYPFKDMAVGESFFAKSRGVSVAAYYFGKRHKRKFTCQREGNGYRIWRIK